MITTIEYTSMNNFIETISKITALEEEAIDELTENLEAKKYRKGDFLLKADETCKYFYFIESGLIKLFFDNGEKDFVMTFFKENAFFSELNSFITGKPSKYMLVALEPVETHRIHKNAIEKLCQKYHCVETLFSRLYATAPVNMMKRIGEMLEDNGKKRYHNFLNERPDLVQRISLGDLADYIGITQVSLSRIRAQK